MIKNFVFDLTCFNVFWHILGKICHIYWGFYALTSSIVFVFINFLSIFSILSTFQERLEFFTQRMAQHGWYIIISRFNFLCPFSHLPFFFLLNLHMCMFRNKVTSFMCRIFHRFEMILHYTLISVILHLSGRVGYEVHLQKCVLFCFQCVECFFSLGVLLLKNFELFPRED